MVIINENYELQKRLDDLRDERIREAEERAERQLLKQLEYKPKATEQKKLS